MRQAIDPSLNGRIEKFLERKSRQHPDLELT